MWVRLPNKSKPNSCTETYSVAMAWYMVGLLGTAFFPGVLVNVSDAMDSAAYRVQQGSAAPDVVFLFRQSGHPAQREPIVDDFCFVVKQHRGNESFPRLTPLLFDHGVEAADGVFFRPLEPLRSRMNTSSVRFFFIGITIKTVSGMLGHFSAWFTLDTYAHVTTAAQKEADDYVDHVVSLARENGDQLKKAKVFCTDSISCEYSHLDEIKTTGAQLIEMETSTFYQLADLFDVPAIALLEVSDNSATGMPLLGQNRDQHEKYSNTRSDIVPDMIVRLAKE